MAVAPVDLSGLKVLIVEDNLLLAEATAETLDIWGCQVLGPAPSVAAALPLAREADLDGALLDINLRGELCFPIAEALHGRAVPFLFITGYDTADIVPPEFQGCVRLSKPVDPVNLRAEMGKHFRVTRPN